MPKKTRTMSKVPGPGRGAAAKKEWKEWQEWQKKYGNKKPTSSSAAPKRVKKDKKYEVYTTRVHGTVATVRDQIKNKYPNMRVMIGDSQSDPTKSAIYVFSVQDKVKIRSMISRINKYYLERDEGKTYPRIRGSTKTKPEKKVKSKVVPKKVKSKVVKKTTKKVKSTIKGVKLTIKQKKHLKDFGYCDITRNGKQHRITPGRVKKGIIQR